VSKTEPARMSALKGATDVLRLRSRALGEEELPGPYEGDLSELGEAFARRFGPAHVWSASRLENYVACGFLFFVGNVLGLEAREEPMEGLDSRQLGNIYHRILSRVYQHPLVTDRTSLEQLLEALPVVAEQVLDEAPKREGFRETAWWAQTWWEIVEHVHQSLEALAELGGEFVPSFFEAPFGLQRQPALVVENDGDALRLRGFIDRVDLTGDGQARIIDYKTSGPSGFTRRAVAEGRKLQLPLYALAAHNALHLGNPVEGFYWHVQQAERSSFTLSGFEGGPRGAIKAALDSSWVAIHGARRGEFVPRPPQGGCPSYCPAAAFCWRYSPGYGG
jgi:ATP-dependent helicase/DNAse subunit B